MGDQLRRAAVSVLKGVAYPVKGGGTMWSFDAYRWGETAPRDVTVRFAGEGGAVSALGRRGGNGTFGTDAGTRWALNEAGVYAVVDTYRPGAIAPAVLSGRRSRGRSSSSGSSNERVRGSCVQLFGTLVCVVVQAVRFC